MKYPAKQNHKICVSKRKRIPKSVLGAVILHKSWSRRLVLYNMHYYH